MIKVRIPATTANMGPGFDSFGMALKLYNEIEIEERKGETIILNNGIKSEENYKDNLIYKSLINTLGIFNYKYDGFIINVSKCDIPICRGLGSSAACIVGGVAAASSLMENRLSLDEIIEIATEIEGHPDNVVPAAVGGMVVSIKDGEKVNYSKIRVPNELKFAAMIPDFQVSTALSRQILPQAYVKEDCIFNISRSAMLISALYNGEFDKLRTCFNDKIHEPYRKKLIKNAEEILEKARETGAVGEFVSGSGSTLMAVVDKDTEKFEKEVKNFLGKLEDNWRLILLEPDIEGIKVASC
ncbi:homoserine kinase [Clostridium sp. OS1-26]|uniref:homoserine kinase n=1 Tax=Clostridium sp. OS1-26 TaxID=3070681 RepID=UPI0027E0F36C|nr:homoserine kinase [Clostridium sp. OS1-26]WML37776.1 homoserine kinase [Clostridium sp. OS1-26]